MITIGITGGYATGKTVVAGMLKRLGAKVVDADKIARSVLRPHTLAWQQVVESFGKGILRKDGFINRQKLAGIAFADPVKTRRLNQLVHPAVTEEIKRIIKTIAQKARVKVIAVDAPLLYEAGIEGLFDKVIVVSCSGEVQYRRAKRRGRLSQQQMTRRIQRQWPLARKMRRADFIVDNKGSIARTRKQVREIWRELSSSRS